MGASPALGSTRISLDPGSAIVWGQQWSLWYLVGLEALSDGASLELGSMDVGLEP